MNQILKQEKSEKKLLEEIKKKKKLEWQSK